MAGRTPRLAFSTKPRDDAFDFSFDFIHHFHCFDDAYDGIRVNFGANFNVTRSFRRWRAIKVPIIGDFTSISFVVGTDGVPTGAGATATGGRTGTGPGFGEFIILNDRCAAIGAALEPYF